MIRWRLLLVGLNIFRRLGDLYIFYLIGASYSLVLPGVIGGDFIRIGLCARGRRENLGLIAVSVLIERICGLTMLFVMGTLSYYLFFDNYNFLSDLWIVELMPPVTALGLISLLVIFIIGRCMQKKMVIKPERETKYTFFLQIQLFLILLLPLPVHFS